MIIALFARDVLCESRPADEPHLVRVKQTKIDRLADVAIGFRPGLADLKNFERGKFVTAALHDRGDTLK